MTDIFEGLRSRLTGISPVRHFGRIAGIGGGMLRITGLGAQAGLGDRVRIAGTVTGEILCLDPEGATVLAEEPVEGLKIGMPAECLGKSEIAPHDGWIGRIVDPFGSPLDGRPLFPGARPRNLCPAPPPPAQRRRLGQRLETGLAVFDTMLPIVRGQRVGLFAGSGVGKSSLLAQLARGMEADVIVIALAGERGREVREFTDQVLGPQGMARSVVVAATSDQSPLLRRRCLWSAMAVAEHFRDAGLQVLLLADSVTRFAEAHREVALAAGESAQMRGYPPSMAQTIMALAERAGPGRATPDCGDITAIFTVLVAGSDMEEPVADVLRGVLDGHVILDRTIAERGRFPAIDLLRSVSRSLPQAASEPENHLIAEARRIFGAWDRAEMMVQAGLYSKGSDPGIDRAIRVWPDLDDFLAQAAPGGAEGSFRRLAEILAR
ncbi:MAG: FliI/YscN family ATPase [Pseudorhodobacter sp.]